MLVFCLIAAVRGSIATANKSELKGQPFPLPRLMLKFLDLNPLLITDESGDVYTI